MYAVTEHPQFLILKGIKKNLAILAPTVLNAKGYLLLLTHKIACGEIIYALFSLKKVELPF